MRCREQGIVAANLRGKVIPSVGTTPSSVPTIQVSAILGPIARISVWWLVQKRRRPIRKNDVYLNTCRRLVGIYPLLALHGDRTKWYRTKWHGQNGTDKMVYGQNGMGQNGMDKMVWTKWYGQNGSNFWNRL